MWTRSGFLMSQPIMRSSPMTEPAQVSGAPICRLTGMPNSACLRARARARGRAPALLTSSGTLSVWTSSSFWMGVRVTTGAPEYFLRGNSISPPNSHPPAERTHRGGPVVSVHLLRKQLAAEALLGCRPHRASAHRIRRRVAGRERDHRHAVRMLPLHDGSHPFSTCHGLAPQS